MGVLLALTVALAGGTYWYAASDSPVVQDPVTGTLRVRVAQMALFDALAVDDYWVVLLPSEEYRVYRNRAPRAGGPLRWHGVVDRLVWDLPGLLQGRRPVVRIRQELHFFDSPATGERYRIDGTCMEGPCDPVGCIVFPLHVMETT